MVDKKYDVKCLGVNICGSLLQVKNAQSFSLRPGPLTVGGHPGTRHCSLPSCRFRLPHVAAKAWQMDPLLSGMLDLDLQSWKHFWICWYRARLLPFCLMLDFLSGKISA